MFLADALESMITHMAGDPDLAEEQYRAAMSTQVTRGTVDAGAALLLGLTTLRYTQGRLSELVPDLGRAYRTGVEALAHLYAFALAETGDADEAREVAAKAPPLLNDYLYVLLLTMRALTLSAVGVTAESESVYEELLPYADLVAGAATIGFVLGPVAQGLGQLALTLGRPDDARRHFERAHEVALRCGSAMWAERAERYLGAAHENAGA
jgi:tetratricopeptide (TPR) repeat protein